MTTKPMLGDYFRKKYGLDYYIVPLIIGGMGREDADKFARELWKEHTGEDYDD